ncbi:MAG: RNA polymerase-binding protein DksA [Gammaproteobacteria bacterium]|nr:MAG: RNA polymerase-binding protein DksA [Gammaproteobacteria bacterium]
MVDLPNNYRPRKNEKYMNEKQQQYFRLKLQAWRNELLDESKQTVERLRGETVEVGDEADRANRESDHALELRTRDRYRKLIGKIDQALLRVDDGTYGFCEETGEPIGIQRLEIRPVAILSVEAQERRELLQKKIHVA